MEKKLDQSKMMQTLEWAYNSAIKGGNVFKSADVLAKEYLGKAANEEEAAKILINWQTAKCSTSGFITGLGGLLTLPVTIPANIASVAFVQLQMIATIAIIGGHDPQSDQVKSLAYLCLTGSSAADIAKNVGIKIGTKIAKTAINKIPGKALTQVNQKVGFRMLTKFGTKGVINFGKAIPIVGGIIGAAFDFSSTKIIGKTAINVFLHSKGSSKELLSN